MSDDKLPILAYLRHLLATCHAAASSQQQQ